MGTQEVWSTVQVYFEKDSAETKVLEEKDE